MWTWKVSFLSSRPPPVFCTWKAKSKADSSPGMWCFLVSHLPFQPHLLPLRGRVSQLWGAQPWDRCAWVQTPALWPGVTKFRSTWAMQGVLNVSLIAVTGPLWVGSGRRWALGGRQVLIAQALRIPQETEFRTKGGQELHQWQLPVQRRFPGEVTESPTSWKCPGYKNVSGQARSRGDMPCCEEFVSLHLSCELHSQRLFPLWQQDGCEQPQASNPLPPEQTVLSSKLESQD